MMKSKYFLLSTFCLWLCVAGGKAQVLDTAFNHVTTIQTCAVDYPSIFADQFDFQLASRQSSSLLASENKNYPDINHLPGLFCKLEYKIETKSKLAPRFRLGSLQYTEWMEGKQDFYLRYYK